MNPLKRITTPAGVFGPYKSVAVLANGFQADGDFLPFSVIGTGTVDDWTGPLPVPTPRPPDVPAEVTMRQARLALMASGKLTQVNALIAAMPGANGDAARIEWEFSSVVKRNQPLVLALGPTLGLTSAQLDSLFVLAQTL